MTTKEKILEILQAVGQQLSLPAVLNLMSVYPISESFGDYATNLALVAAKELKTNPLDLAAKIQGLLLTDPMAKEMFLKVEVVKPGFINFFLSQAYLEGQLAEILKKKEKYAWTTTGKGKKVQLEFISANPTGPLTLANGRGGFLGDVLANILALTGCKVEREYFINDTGNQVNTLGKSVLAAASLIPKEDTYYGGDYVQAWADSQGAELEKYRTAPEIVGKQLAEHLFAEKIKPVIENGMKIKFDRWFSEEAELHQGNKIKPAVNFLVKQGLTYEVEGATWFTSTKFGDDKDRVLITADGRYTYFAVDVAYHLNKFKRGFAKVINIWGADHGGYIARLQAAVQALGYGGQLDVIIMQLVKLVSGNREVRMSKRKGDYVTMEYLLMLLPLDVIRWFFLMYAVNTHMTIDLDLAKDKSEKNPVYYVQYAYARLSNILLTAKEHSPARQAKLEVGALAMIKPLLRWPELVGEVAETYQVNQLTTYALLVADSFHRFYQTYRVIDNGTVNQLRYKIVQAYHWCWVRFCRRWASALRKKCDLRESCLSKII
jgi:arginyl-tRNA synthetase